MEFSAHTLGSVTSVARATARKSFRCWMHRFGVMAGLLAAGMTGGSNVVWADEPDSELAELRARLDLLEQQNAELRAQVLSPQSVFTTSNTSEAAISEDDARIRSIVGQYLAEKKAEEKANEDAKKAASEEEGHEVGSDLNMTAKWNNGLELSTKNKDFRIHIGGRTQYDGAAFWPDPSLSPPNINQPYQNGNDFRRARLRIDGTMYEQQEFAVEYDFVNSSRFPAPAASTNENLFDVTALTDVWWQLKEVPIVGNIRIGNQKEAIGFEHLVSSRYLPFMERSYNQDTFYGGSYNGFTPGVAIFDSYGEDTGSWNIGIYKPVSNVFAFNAHTGDYAVTGRVTKLLRYEAEGADLIHVGLGARQFTTANDQIRYRTRDAIRSGNSQVWPLPADTGTLFANTGQFLAPELAAVHGPWTFQAEYLANWTQDVRKAAAGPVLAEEVFYHGGYMQLFYFLTGEHDNYSKERAAFDRVKPRENFFIMRSEDCVQSGWGAWQIGARYNYLNWNSQGINGGILNNYTVGLNWFWNPNMKVQFNYMLTDRNSAAAGGVGDGTVEGLGMRFAHDF